MKKRRRMLTVGRLVAIMAGVAIAVRVVSGLVGVAWFAVWFLAYLAAMGLRHSPSRDTWIARRLGVDENSMLLMGFFAGVAILLGIAGALENQEYGVAAVLGGMTAGGIVVTWLLTKKGRRYKTRDQRRREAAREAARTLDESKAWTDE